MAGALDGIKVVELGHWVAVPSACAILADWGAEVIKIENPGMGDGLRGMRSIEGIPMSNHLMPVFEVLNRGKRGLGVDLRLKQGREIVYRLVERSDVFVSNFQPRVLDKLGMDYETLGRRNSKLVYASLTGYGESGADREKPGYDYAAFWARGGLMSKLCAPSGTPPSHRPGIGDNITSMCITSGILAALLSRERGGRGQKVAFSLYQTAAWVMNQDLQVALYRKEEIPNIERLKAKNPLWNSYRTGDGRWIQLAMMQSERYWPGFCKAVGRPELQQDTRFDTDAKRERNNEALVSIIGEIFAARTLREWMDILDRHGMVNSMAQTVMEITGDPQAEQNGFFARLDHPNAGEIRLVASPVKFSETGAEVQGPAPQVGQHTEEILLEAGYSWEDITRLKDEGAII
ncbi:MAG: CoA transferase [Acidobacteria bacterium]|nr:CoA transferase [Acidobacteriota bacterium]